MKQDLILLCESVILEQHTNKVSFISAFESMSSSNLPVTYLKFAVCTRFEDGKGTHDHEIVIKHEDSNEVIAKLPGKINFNDNGKAQYIGNFIGVKFPKFGRYIIESHVDNQIQPLTTNLEVIKV